MSSQSDLDHKSSSCVSVVRLSVILISSQDPVPGHNSAGCLHSHDSRVSSLSKLKQGVSQTHCRPRPELDIDLIPDYLSPCD